MKGMEKCPVCGAVKSKSSSQRNKFHQLCREIGKELGLEPGRVKEMIKQDFFGFDEVAVGGRWYRVLRSSESAGKDEYSELIEHAYRWAAMNGVAINE